jgi:hypothetical protein
MAVFGEVYNIIQYFQLFDIDQIPGMMDVFSNENELPI